MVKRFISGLTAITMLLSVGSMAVFADEDPSEYDPYYNYVPREEGELSAEEIMDKLLDNEGTIDSDNIMTQEILEDMEELELSGSGMIGGGTASPDWIADPDHPYDDTTLHANIVSAIRNYLGSDYSETDKDQIIALMIYSANIADDSTFHYIDSPIHSNPTQLHAVYGTNYLTNLKILWKYSKLVTSNTLAQTESLIADSMVNLNTNDEDDMETLFDSIHSLYSNYKQYYGITRSLTARERKYLVMGFALHLIGDIYAHASIVPASYGNPSVFNPYFDVDDFISYPAYIQCMNAIANANGTTSFRTTEFINYLKNSSSMPQNKYYEDNKNFMPQRIKLSKLSAIKFVSRIHQSGQTFSSSYVIRHYEKDDGPIYDVTLANFAALETRL